VEEGFRCCITADLLIVLGTFGFVELLGRWTVLCLLNGWWGFSLDRLSGSFGLVGCSSCMLRGWRRTAVSRDVVEDLADALNNTMLVGEGACFCKWDPCA
jgi:hypothetical protein